MVRLTAEGVLGVWERAAGLTPAGRALALLEGCAGPGPGSAAGLTVGDRDRALIAAYRALFGRRLVARADCPACGELHETDLDLAGFDAPAGEAAGRVAVAGCEAHWRQPTAGDAAEVAGLGSAAAARDELLRRCVTAVTRGGEPVAPGDWPPGLAEAVAAAMDRADPLADVRLGLACVRCEHAWAAGFDIAAFLWAEVGGLARRLLAEVHRLASAYGWDEADILAMTAARRAAYLRMCGG